MPSKCARCARHEECRAKAQAVERRQVFDAIARTEVTEYGRLRATNCPVHGWTRDGRFPEGINAAVQYGETLQALAVALNTVGAVGVCRTQEIPSGVFGIPLSEGTISTAKKQGCNAFEAIKQEIMGTPNFIFSRCAE